MHALKNSCRTLLVFLVFVHVSLSAVEEPLKLEAFVQPSTNLYPGQKFTLNYRISFKGDIELTKEVLPFVNPAPLEKTSPLEAKELSAGGYNIQQITQEVRANQAGKIGFGPALLEGTLKAYLEGNPEVQSIPVKAELPAMEIVVNAFPIENKPVSFTGALGNYTMAVSLLSSATVNVDDSLSVQIVISGKGEWDTVKLPNLMCQPGFSGFFQLSDLPPQEKKEENSKTFIVELRVISPHVASLPVIEFSFFNVEKEQYQTLRSEKIAISIKNSVEGNARAFFSNKELYDNREDDWQKILSSLDVKDVNGEPLQAKTPAEKNLLLNQALSLSLKVNQEDLSPYDLGWHFYDLANLYFELNEFSKAIFYLEKAKLLLPGEKLISSKLKEVNDKLGLQEVTSSRFYLRAIVIESSLLRTGPSPKYPPVNLKPLMPGEVVFVLNVIHDGKWLKVRTSDGSIGYVDGRQNQVI